MKSIRLSIGVLAIILTAAFTSGCGVGRLNQFRSFSRAGVEYAKACQALTEQAGTAAIDTDSVSLEKVREGLTEEQRQKLIQENTQLLRERLELLADLSRHAELLQEYFEVLAEMSESNSPQNLDAAAQGVFKSLSNVSERIRNFKVPGGPPLGGLVGAGAQLAAAQFRVRALNNEINRRKEAISEELELQAAALKALRGILSTDLQAQINMRESREVLLPYVSDDRLPGNWSRTRRDVLLARQSLAGLEAAESAAQKMKAAFAALIEQRLDGMQVSQLIQDAQAVASIVKSIRLGSGSSS